MQLGVCTSPEKIKQSVAGLDFIEGAVGDILCPREGEDKFAARLAVLKACPVSLQAVNCFIPGDLKTTGPGVRNDALDTYVQTAMKRAQAAGVRTIVFGSGGSRRIPDGFDARQAAEQVIGHLKRWGKIAAHAGVIIVLEPLNKAECNIVTTVGEGADLVRRAGHPNIKLLCDTFHMARDNDPPEAIRKAKGLIAHVHVAEGDGRGPLGTKGENQRPFFRALKDIGYTGRVSIEASWADWDKQLPPALIELRNQIGTA